MQDQATQTVNASEFDGLGLSPESMDVLLRYERGSFPSPAAMMSAMRRGVKKTPWYRSPDAAQSQDKQNTVQATVEQMVAQRQAQSAMNSHVADYLRMGAQTSRGGTLAQGRAYAPRVNGRHSYEQASQLGGECSDAGRRLEECKHSGHQADLAAYQSGQM